MTAINSKRVLLGALAGAVVWSVWTSMVTMVVLGSTYAAGEKAGQVLATPRFGGPLFFLSWFLTIFVVSGLCATVYAAVRGTWGARPRTALILGLILGFLAAFPLNLSIISWLAVNPKVPLFWLLDVWVGITMATFVGAYFYKD